MKRATEMVLVNRFERAGMGAAPYRFVGMDESVLAYPDGTTRPGSSCDYCSTAIRYVFTIESADGRRHKVGCECVRHTGDAGLVRKATEHQRKIDRDKRHARESRKLEAERAWFESVRSQAVQLPHPKKYFADQDQTLADFVDWYRKNAGTSGELSAYFQARARLA